MKFIICIFLIYLSFVSSFRSSFPVNRAFTGRRQSKFTQLRFSDNASEDKKYNLVPVDKVNTENAAAVTGGILGFILGGPIIGAVLAAVTNYAAKKDDDSGEALRGFGKTVVESFNFLTKLNSKYNLLPSFTKKIDNALSSAARENEAIGKVKETLSSTVDKVSELNQEYQLVEKGKELVVAAATLSDTAIEKALELNKKVKR